MLLLPETLEMSKVCSILSDDLSFKVDELISLKEIQKYVDTKENLIEILNLLEKEGIIKNQSSNEYSILLKDEDCFYNLANIPTKMSKLEIISFLGLNENSIKRLYKQALFWVLVLDDNSVNQEFQNLLNSKNLKENETEIKFDVSNGKNLRKALNKKTQHFNYIKETDELKASPQDKRKESYNKMAYNSNTSNTSEHFSWRKKSDVSSNSKDE